MPLLVSRLRSQIALLVTLMFVAGCGGGGSLNTAHWQGNVTIGGAPAPADAEGSIIFRPAGKTGKVETVQIKNGQYDSPNTPKGKVLAFIDLQQPTGETEFSERVQKDIPIMKNLVPLEHSRGIELNVEGDKSDAHIEL